MYCVNCGKELPDDANFCLKCGKPQKSNIEQVEKRYETCEITWEKIKPAGLFNDKGEVRLWAEAVGPKGRYCAMKTDSFKIFMYAGNISSSSEDKNGAEYLNWLVQKLVDDGWEPLGKGNWWYSYQFRRVIKA